MSETSGYERSIRSSNRGDGGTVLGLDCGHAVLRRPNYSIPPDLLIECEECAILRQRREA